MAVWRKILVSGSNAHVAAITASIAGTPIDKSQAIFRDDSTGRFFSTGSIFYTSSNGSQLYLDKTGLTAFNISASGTPDSLSDNAEVLFRNPTTTGVEATSSLFYDSSNNQLVFSSSNGAGTFSGSFTGDGSGLTGVVGTLAQALVNGDGIASSSYGEAFEWNGTDQVTVTIYTASNSGLTFTGGVMHIANSLPGDGLKWDQSSNFSSMSVALSPGGISGLDTSSGELSISSSIAGDGLAYSNGVLSVNVASNGGVVIDSDELKLDDSLDGFGLTYQAGQGNSILDVDASTVVTSSNRITFKTGSSNLTLSATSTPDNVEVVAGGFSARLIDSPTFTYDLNGVLTGDFTFEQNVNVEGNFTVSGTLISASFETENLNIADQFILLNSGSDTGDGGFVVQASNADQGQGAFLFFDSESKRWGVSDTEQGINSESHRVTDNDHAAIVTTTISNSPESTLINSTPIFGTTDTTKMGQLAITTAASSSESSVFIYA